MSAVDCIAHVHLGDFNDMMGVYWPVYAEANLSRVTDDDRDDGKILSPYHLLLGGGSGEHKAMPIINDAAVLQYFGLGSVFKETYVSEDFTESDDIEVVNFFTKLEKLIEKYMFEHGGREDRWYWHFNQNYWDVESFIDLDKTFQSLGLYNHLKDRKELFSRILVDSVGSIIINELPEAAIEDKEIKELVSLFKEHQEKFKPYMNEEYVENIKLLFEIPEQICGVNAKILKERGEKFKWGYSLEDWKNDFEMKTL